MCILANCGNITWEFNQERVLSQLSSSLPSIFVLFPPSLSPLSPLCSSFSPLFPSPFPLSRTCPELRETSSTAESCVIGRRVIGCGANRTCWCVMRVDLAVSSVCKVCGIQPEKIGECDRVVRCWMWHNAQAHVCSARSVVFSQTCVKAAAWSLQIASTVCPSTCKIVFETQSTSAKCNTYWLLQELDKKPRSTTMSEICAQKLKIEQYLWGVEQHKKQSTLHRMHLHVVLP